jgi:crotonobetainyl-CoA:carnitine CoA-transferase CaiB-like acyl-CoA transferase
MWLAQRAGVPAHECSTNEDLFDDPQKRHRGFVRHGSFPGWPKADFRGPAFILSETPGAVRSGEPVEGQDNYQVFGDVLGLSRDQVDKLKADKAIY